MLTIKRRIGQTCPDADWQDTLTRHPRLGARRIFSSTTKLPIGGVKTEVAAGRLPVVSIKTSPYTWADVIAGEADPTILAHLDTLDGLGGEVAFTVHHEPTGDGDPAAWATMQNHIVGLVQSKPRSHVKYGVVLNGWPCRNDGDYKSTLPVLLPQPVLSRLDWVGIDAYESASGAVTVAEQVANLARWVGSQIIVVPPPIVVGEFGVRSEASLRATLDALRGMPEVAVALYYNTNVNSSFDWRLPVRTDRGAQIIEDALDAITPPPPPADAELVAELTKKVADLQAVVTAQRELVTTLATRIGEVITTLGDDQARADHVLDLIGGAASILATSVANARSGIVGDHAAAIHALSDAKAVADAATVVTP